MYRLQFYLIYFSFILLGSIECLQKAKDNGSIYITNEESFLKDIKQSTDAALLSSTTTNMPENPNFINFDELISLCNSSFYIPMQYYVQFNTTGQLPDLVDKTGMCFVRCVYEKSGLIDNWKLNAEKIRANIWPATGDSIEVCEKEGAKEKNACVRTYAIAKCLTLRALVDARNKPM
ncbi:general odorant-binding protein 84a [Lucilia sericata]|uniref:general odorant-binding protein 84a n=1 Tax=Lucilia sericata TaxID=13632 RepID=UPI0018A7E890|nr:general odorant-binding protein 84a [Lucilia sericata]